MKTSKNDYCCYLYKLFAPDKEQLLIVNKEFQIITIYKQKLYFVFNGSKKFYLSKFGMDIYSVCRQKEQVSYDGLLCWVFNKYSGYPKAIIAEHFFQVILNLKRNEALYGKRF